MPQDQLFNNCPAHQLETASSRNVSTSLNHSPFLPSQRSNMSGNDQPLDLSIMGSRKRPVDVKISQFSKLTPSPLPLTSVQRKAKAPPSANLPSAPPYDSIPVHQRISSTFPLPFASVAAALTSPFTMKHPPMLDLPAKVGQQISLSQNHIVALAHQIQEKQQQLAILQQLHQLQQLSNPLGILHHVNVQPSDIPQDSRAPFQSPPSKKIRRLATSTPQLGQNSVNIADLSQTRNNVPGSSWNEEAVKLVNTCLICRRSFDSLPDLTKHMAETKHYKNICSGGGGGVSTPITNVVSMVPPHVRRSTGQNSDSSLISKSPATNEVCTQAVALTPPCTPSEQTKNVNLKDRNSKFCVNDFKQVTQNPLANLSTMVQLGLSTRAPKGQGFSNL